MTDRPILGYSSIAASERRATPWERIRKIVIFSVAAVLLAIFFTYLTRQVQIGSAQATNPDASWKSETQ
jgi:hypothetical protein